MDLRFKWKFPILVLLLEIVFLVLFLVFVRYDFKTATPKPLGDKKNVTFNETELGKMLKDFNANDHKFLEWQAKKIFELQEKVKELEEPSEAGIERFYAMFMDVQLIAFIGIGFLMTFLKRYGYSSVGLNFFLGAFCIQWDTLIHGFIQYFSQPEHENVIHVDLESLIKADFSAVALMISFGVVLGKVSPVQVIVMVLFETVFYEGNQKICFDMLKATDIGDSMVVHVFGAYFGLAIAFVLYRSDIEDAEEKEGSVYQSDLFAMIGTVFLWICWPSFNASTAIGEGRTRAVINTYYSIAGSLIMTFVMSSFVNKKGKFQMEHIQNSSLAGGVAIGTVADLILQPGVAMVIGMVAGAISVLGYSFLTPLLFKKARIHDTCGVHNLHGIPGLISAIASVIVALYATPELYQSNYDNHFAYKEPNMVAGMQAACLGVSLLFAIVGGLITGVVMKLPIFDTLLGNDLFDDEDFWVIPVDESEHVSPKQKLIPK